jgi:hydrogenase nickel incorporation protein HypA/HybF
LHRQSESVHEVSVMSSIVEAVLQELDKHDIEKVEAVDMVVGELTFLGEDQLQFAYEIITRDTILEGSKLNIIPEKTEIKCNSCGYIGPVNYIHHGDHYSHPDLSCPKCGGGVEILKGKSAAVRSVQVVEN